MVVSIEDVESELDAPDNIGAKMIIITIYVLDFGVDLHRTRRSKL